MSLPSEQRWMKSSTRATSAGEGYAYGAVKSPVRREEGLCVRAANGLPSLPFSVQGMGDD